MILSISALPPYIQFLLAYGIVITAVTFFYFGFDKSRSTKEGARRVRERTLWFLMAIGGSVGGLLGMHIFRHKTKKLSFQAGVAVILLVQVGVIVWMLRNM